MDQKSVLMIAFHYPPDESSGAQRTKGFVRHLPTWGWSPVVLTVSKFTHGLSKVEGEGLGNVKRAFALDITRHLSLFGRYPGWLAFPDHVGSWFLEGVRKGLSIIKKYNIKVIWSTFPVATAHAIGFALKRLTGLPWIADFRDPMLQSREFHTSIQRATFKWIEKTVWKYADICVFTTASAKDDACRGCKSIQRKSIVIENGFEESEFFYQTFMAFKKNTRINKIILVHSGLLYKHGRNPENFFMVIADLKRENRLPEGLNVILRGSGFEEYYEKIIKNLHLEQIILLRPRTKRARALEEMAHADGLLLFQGELFNRQVPAKVYEYFAMKKPILGLVDLSGETARILKRYPSAKLGKIAEKESIRRVLLSFFEELPKLKQKARTFNPDQFSRKSRAKELAFLLNRVVLVQRK